VRIEACRSAQPVQFVELDRLNFLNQAGSIEIICPI
jgi:hypothetical protein